MYSSSSSHRGSWCGDESISSNSPQDSSSGLGLFMPETNGFLPSPDGPSLQMPFDDSWSLPPPPPLEAPFESNFMNHPFQEHPSPLTHLDTLPPEAFSPGGVAQHYRGLPNIHVDMAMLTVAPSTSSQHYSPTYSPAMSSPQFLSDYNPRGSIGVHSSPSSTGGLTTPLDSPLALRGLDGPHIAGYSRTPPRSPVEGSPTPCLHPVVHPSVLEIASRTASPHDGIMVPQKVYRPHTQSDRRRYVEEVQLEPPIMFYLLEPDSCGISLADAISSKFMRLVGRDDLMFQGRGPSVSIRLMWPGYAPWSRQIPTRDFRSPPGPITRAKLAKNVAKTVQRFIDEMADVRMEEDADPRWRVGKLGIRLEHLVLVGLQHVSMGSWQAFVRIRPHVMQ